MITNIDLFQAKIMAKATETGNVVECAANEMLRTSLPVMYTELEKCQKSLEGYLEQKRNKFPRFYFVSNPGEVEILCCLRVCPRMVVLKCWRTHRGQCNSEVANS